MGHYEERLERDLTRLRKQVLKLGDRVQKALEAAVHSVLEVDKAQAAEVVLGDLEVNRLSRDLDRLCHIFVARHLPSAGHLRFVSSAMRMSIALERIGDYAATIGRTALQLSSPPPEPVAHDIDMMSEHAGRLLKRALKAFGERDVDQARATMVMAGQITATFDKVFADLGKEGERGERPIQDLFGLLATFNRLERVIHQAKNLCEETIFIETGETKPHKTFDVLFLDERNDGASQLAEAYARKGWPDLGRFESAGWNPAPTMREEYIRFGIEKGLDLSDARPRPLETILDQIADYDIVVDLGSGAVERLGKLPFHTIPLTWGLPLDGDPEEAYKVITPSVRELMDKLGAERDDD